MTDREGLHAKCHKCGAEPGAVCRTPKGSVHKHGTHDGRGRQLTDGTRHYYTPTEVRKLLHDAIKAEREACAKVCEEVEEPAWYGYENPNTFDDGTRAAAAAIHTRGE